MVSLRDGLDPSTAAGRLQIGVLSVLAAFERDRLREPEARFGSETTRRTS